MTESLYPTSALNGGRYRRTKAELAEIDTAIYEIAEAEEPVTVRGLFYRVMSRGLVPKTEQGYGVVQRQALKMRAVWLVIREDASYSEFREPAGEQDFLAFQVGRGREPGHQRARPARHGQ